jgi:hypothetical protein
MSGTQRSIYRKEHEINDDKIGQEVEGAGQRLQERKAASPDERQEGKPDQVGAAHAHRRMGMSENLVDLAVRPRYEQIVGSIRHSGVQEILRRAQEVEDEITEQHSILTTHVQSGVS